MLKELKLQGLSEEQARELMTEMAKDEVQVSDDEDEAESGDLLSSVRKWMAEQKGKITSDSLREFNLQVRFQGHVDTTPPDHVGAILRVIVEETCASCDLAAPKLQPTVVAKKAESLVARWSTLLEQLYQKIDDPLTAADVIIQAVEEGVAAQNDVSDTNKACGVVGCLMALREIDMIEDEDLLTGCRRTKNPSHVMDKFIDFLEEALEDEDDEDE